MENANPYSDKLNRWSSHNQIAAMLDGLPNGARVLDVGAGSGAMELLVIDMLPNYQEHIPSYYCSTNPFSQILGSMKMTASK